MTWNITFYSWTESLSTVVGGLESSSLSATYGPKTVSGEIGKNKINM